MSANSAHGPSPHRGNAWSTVGAEADARVAGVEERLSWIRSTLDARGARGLLVRSRATFAWLTLGGLNHVVVGSEGGAIPILVTRDGAWALAPVNEAARVADEELTGLPVEVRSLPWEDPAAARAEVQRLTEAGHVLEEGDLGDELVARRSALGEIEHGRMRALAADVGGAMDEVLESVRAADTEDAVAGGVARALLERGARAPVLLVAADDRIARYRHPLPTRRAARARLMVVTVAERWGLHVATTRFLDLEPPSAELLRRMAATAEILEAMRSATRAGATLDAVLQATRAAYRATGFEDEWRLHHQGGTIGYAPRERIATPGDPAILRPGMAVAWNPSVTGTKLEATMIVTHAEPEELAR